MAELVTSAISRLLSSYMFRPSAPTSMSLTSSFILRYVTAPSSVTGFTPTMASSENPLSLTATFLLRLGLGCRSYNGPEQTALHRVRSYTFIAHPPLIPCRITERISGFDNRRYLAHSAWPTRGSHQVWVANLTRASFRSLIGFPSPVDPSSGRSGKFLRAPLPLSIHSLLSGL